MKPQHPTDDDKAAYQYEQYLQANNPNVTHENEWHENLLAPEPDFPGEVFER